MSDTKFTPGPWAHTNGIIFVGEPENVPDSQIRTFSSIANMSRRNEVVANTALVTAAPEIYKALELAESTLELFAEHYVFTEILAQIKRTLANARGES